MKAGHWISICGPLFDLTGIGCCSSCLADDEDGYSGLILRAPPTRRRHQGRLYAEACCVHAGMEPRDNQRTWWAVVIGAGRKAAGRCAQRLLPGG